MKLNQLEALIAIADKQGIAGAAEKLNVSQPAITKSLSSLENELGVDLLDRSAYRLKLNAYGEMLLTHARAIAAESEQAVSNIQRMRDKGQQTIRVNCPPGIMPTLIPLALQRARKKIPGLIFELEGPLIASPESKYRGLSEGDYDLLIYATEDTHDTENFDCELLIEDVQMIILASKDHPALKLDKPSLKELVDFDWVSSSKTGPSHKLLQNAFAAEGVKIPDSMLFLPLADMIYSLLQHGEYLAFVAYHPAIVEELEFRVIDADFPNQQLSVSLLQRKTSNPSKAMQIFIEELKQVALLAKQGKL